MFLPSGTMCNQIAHPRALPAGRRGDRRRHGAHLHVRGRWRLGAGRCADLAAGDQARHLQRRPKVEAALRDPGGRHGPRSRLVSIEQTVNRGGGSVWPLEAIEEVARTAHRHGLAVHMDGARILNAVVASGIAAQRMAAPCDSVWLDLSKGLGCPVGGVLAGSRAFIDEAWRWKHRLGGALRQSGILAAAGLYALDHNVERLAEDHANARRLGRHARQHRRAYAS